MRYRSDLIGAQLELRYAPVRGTIAGRLTDPAGNPLAGLSVGLPNGGPNTMTDTNGVEHTSPAAVQRIPFMVPLSRVHGARPAKAATC